VGVGVVSTLLAVPAPEAQAAGANTVNFTGHGYGHGRGLGQWGSYGYATTGAPYTAILSHYYGGTTQSTQPNGPITVALTAQDGKDLLVTSAQPFSVGGIPVSGGAAAIVSALPDGTFRLSTTLGCGQPPVWTTAIPTSRVVPGVDPGNDLTAMLTVCGQGGTRTYRGELSVVNVAGNQRTINTVRMEDYLRGVVPRESPASWADAAGGKGIEALKAQSVAARSYAWAENRAPYAKSCDTTACQVYGGAGLNGALIEDPRTDRAIAATADVVLRNSAGAIVRAEFSSSTGGHTAGGAFPAVPDLGDTASPHHNWSQAVSGATVASAYGVGDLVDVRVTKRNGLGADGGRVTEVTVVGTLKTVTASGADMRTKLGLRSDWFSVASIVAGPPPPPVSVQPVVHLGGATVTAVPFGGPRDLPLACDWDGDGVDTLGVFRAGTWFVGNTPGVGSVSASFGFGQGGDQPVCGDWDGNGSDSVGVYRGGRVFLRNTLTTGIADGQFWFGQNGDRLVTGDWNGDSFDTVGIARSGVFHLTDSNLLPLTSATIPFGDRSDLATAGDWDGNGTDTVGVFRAGVFFLRQSNVPGPADVTVGFGDGGDRPLPGRWTTGSPDVVGVARGY
jgi:SpoIID/LytB domain protein